MSAVDVCPSALGSVLSSDAILLRYQTLSAANVCILCEITSSYDVFLPHRIFFSIRLGDRFPAPPTCERDYPPLRLLRRLCHSIVWMPRIHRQSFAEISNRISSEVSAMHITTGKSVSKGQASSYILTEYTPKMYSKKMYSKH